MKFEYYSEILPNGLKVFVCRDTYRPLVTAELIIKSGSRYEKVNEQGFAHLLEHMFFHGTKTKLDKFAIHYPIESRGGDLNAFTNKNTICFIATLLDKDLEIGLETISDMVLNPTINDEALEMEKGVVIEELKRSYLNNFGQLSRYSMYRQVLGENHPISLFNIGTEKSIRSADRETLMNYKNNLFTPERSALLFYGNISKDEAIEMASKHFSNWQNKNNQVINDKLVSSPQKRFAVEVDARVHQKFINYGFVLPNYREVALKELTAFNFLKEFLTSDMTSYLTNQIRSNGLAYGISSGLFLSTDISLFNIFCQSSKHLEVIDQIKKSLIFVRSINDDDFSKLKTKTLCKFEINSTGTGEALDLFVDNFIFNEDYKLEDLENSIKDLTLSDFLSTIEKYFLPAQEYLNIYSDVSLPDFVF